MYNGQNIEGYDDGAARIQLLYQPSGQFNALFNVHARALSGTARVFRANIIKRGTNDLVDGFNENVVSINGKNQQNLRTNGANANLTWKIGDISLHSITGYESIGNYFTRGDIDGGDSTNTPFPVETAGGVTDHKQLTQEFRIASETPGPFSWQTGLYYFFEDLTAASYGYRSSTGLQTSYATTSQINAAYAAFGSATYDVTSQLNLRAGVRYTDDKKTFTKRIGFSDPGATKLSGSKTTGDVSANVQDRSRPERLRPRRHRLSGRQLQFAVERTVADVGRARRPSPRTRPASRPTCSTRARASASTSITST